MNGVVATNNNISTSLYTSNNTGEECNKVIKNSSSVKTLNLDTYEKSDDNLDQNCQIYSNVNIASKTFFGDKFGYKMQDEIYQSMCNYYAGKVSEEEVSAYFENCCKDMLNYRMHQGQTSGQNIEDNQTIVTEMYEIFSQENQIAALNANEIEGKAINSEYQKSSLNDYVYYNSDYYYKCESMRDVFRNMTQKMTDDWDVPAIDTKEVEKNTIFKAYGGFDFNSGWNSKNRNSKGISSIEDEKMIPPENFILFYKERTDPNNKNAGEASKGVLSINCGKYQKITDVPFTTRYPNMVGQIFNVSELLGKLGEDIENNEDYNSFLKNFTVFTRTYSADTGINHVFGNFVPEY